MRGKFKIFIIKLIKMEEIIQKKIKLSGDKEVGKTTKTHKFLFSKRYKK